jgi:hypothetical protein
VKVKELVERVPSIPYYKKVTNLVSSNDPPPHCANERTHRDDDIDNPSKSKQKLNRETEPMVFPQKISERETTTPSCGASLFFLSIFCYTYYTALTVGRDFTSQGRENN